VNGRGDAIVFVENYVAGGADRIARILVDHLPFRRIHLFVNRSNDNAILCKPPLPDNVEVISYRLPTTTDLAVWARRRTDSPAVYTLLRVVNGLLRFPLVVFSVFYFYRLFRRTTARVFISNNGGYPGGEYNRSAVVAAWLTGRMAVFQIVHNMAVRPSPLMKPFALFYDRVQDRCSQVVCVSKATIRRIKRVRLFSQDIPCIYNGLRSVTLPVRSGGSPVSILNVGSLDSRKNQLMILNVLQRLRSQGRDNFRMIFVGKEEEPGYLAAMEERVRQAGLQDRVCFEGFRSDPQPYYTRCDLFVLSSTVESLPVVILEAMRAGMPVVATDVGGTGEQVIQDETGFLVHAGDEEEMAAKLGLLIDSPELRRQMGQKAYRRFMSVFTIDRMIASYCRLFEVDRKETGNPC
jgi:glycosyltransferase involved in cell wall biosynthesis